MDWRRVRRGSGSTEDVLEGLEEGEGEREEGRVDVEKGREGGRDE